MPQRHCSQPDLYHGYLVRLWRVDPNTPWQIVAKDVETGDEFPFRTLEHLLDFLRAKIATGPDTLC